VLAGALRYAASAVQALCAALLRSLSLAVQSRTTKKCQFYRKSFASLFFYKIRQSSHTGEVVGSVTLRRRGLLLGSRRRKRRDGIEFGADLLFGLFEIVGALHGEPDVRTVAA